MMMVLKSIAALEKPYKHDAHYEASIHCDRVLHVVETEIETKAACCFLSLKSTAND